MFFCAISGEPPQDPVVSSKSGHVYERRLITKYITDNGTDPLTGEKLDESDLISVKASMSRFPTCYSYRSHLFYSFRPQNCPSQATHTNFHPRTPPYPPKRMGRPRSRDFRAKTAVQLHPSGA